MHLNIVSKLRPSFATRFLGLVAVAAAGIAPSQAFAATPVACSKAINEMLDDAPDWLNAFGTRVTARGAYGFSAFTMRDGFQIEDVPVDDPAFPRQRSFTAKHRDADNYEGMFSEVFTDRGNADEDRVHFWVRRGGQFWLRFVTYTSAWKALQNAQCFRGPDGQVVVRATIDNVGYGTDFWTFLIAPGYLI